MSAGHVALVLAAGGSTRLGQPKQLLARDAETLVHRAVRLALETGVTQAFVVTGAHAQRVSAAVDDLPCVTIHNAHWSEGLSSSLRHASPYVASAALPVLVLACDQPALEADHLRALVQNAHASLNGCAATAYGADPGIPAVLPCDWFGNADALHGDRGFRARLQALGDALTRVDAPAGLWLDIDTEDALDRARAQGLIDPMG